MNYYYYYHHHHHRRRHHHRHHHHHHLYHHYHHLDVICHFINCPHHVDAIVLWLHYLVFWTCDGYSS